MTPRELLEACIAKSGLSSRQFALRVMGRNDRTVRRWLETGQIPEVPVRWLKTYLAKEVPCSEAPE